MEDGRTHVAGAVATKVEQFREAAAVTKAGVMMVEVVRGDLTA
jgi:hypothetical protein